MIYLIFCLDGNVLKTDLSGEQHDERLEEFKPIK
jgi:hypothetical protein